MPKAGAPAAMIRPATGEHLTQFGYRISAFQIAPHYHPDDYIDLGDKTFGVTGAHGYLKDLLKDMRDGDGDVDNRASDYLRVDEIHADPWRLALKVSGGTFGESLEVVNTKDHKKRGDVAVDDAVLREGIVVLVVPPTGDHGLIISEAVGRSHHGVPLATRLDRKLRASSHSIQVQNDIADAVAWQDLLSQTSASVTQLTFFSSRPSSDGTAFAPVGVERAKIELFLAPGSRKAKAVSKAIKKGARQATLKGLTKLVGLSNLQDGQFDSQSAVVVHDGVKRTIHVGQDAPRFVYVTGETRLDFKAFLATVRPAAEDTLNAFSVAYPANWWGPLKKVT